MPDTYWDQFGPANPDNPYGVNTDLANGAPAGSAQPTGAGPLEPAWQGQPNPNGPVYGTGAPNGNPAGNAPANGQGDPVAFIRQWQATHPASANAPQEIIAALKAAGFNASPYMYGNTPSGNEISLNGEKFKVIGGENGGSPFWYRGEDDSPGGGFQGLAGPTGNGLYNVPGGGPLNAFLPLPTGLDYTNDPGYQARMKMGTDAIQNSAAAKGTLLSGKTLADLTTFAQDYGSNEYGTAFDRAMRSQDAVFGRNFNLAGLGLRGAEGLSSAYGANADRQSNLVGSQGDANAANEVSGGQRTAQTLADIASGAISAYYGRQLRPQTGQPQRYNTIPGGS